METIDKLSRRYNNWHVRYVEGALTTGDTKFWILFCGSAIFSCCVYFVYSHFILDYMVQSKSKLPEGVVSVTCSLFPFVTLRRLHDMGLLIACYFLIKWLF
jgi:uncharacterized membrane protein YhaH (DUF805 family)